MTQPTFVVVLHEPNDAAFARLQTRYDFHQITPTVAVVRGEKLLTSTIAVTAGTSKNSDPPIPGIVFRLNRAFSGYSWNALWEWLESADEAAG